MVKKRKDYEMPNISLTHVELESAICSGSVDYDKGKESLVSITAQDDASTNGANDFSATGWDMDETTK